MPKSQSGTSRPSGLLQPLDIPEWKWEHIAMDFLVGLPKTKSNHDAIWVVIDRLTKSAHFLPINERSLEKVVKLYLDEIVMRHGVPTDGQSERTIQTIEDMLRTCAIDFKGNWDDHLPLIEFSYNNRYHASIGMPPYEALYGRKCRSPTYWDEVGERKLLSPELVQQTKEKLSKKMARLRRTARKSVPGGPYRIEGFRLLEQWLIGVYAYLIIRVKVCESSFPNPEIEGVTILLEDILAIMKDAKKNRRIVLTQEYEHFDSRDNESLTEIYDRFQKLLNDLSLVNKEYNLGDSNLKFLLALPEKWDFKVTSIRDYYQLDITPLDEICGVLKTHGLEMEQRSYRKGSKARPVTLKVEEKPKEKARRKSYSKGKTMISKSDTESSNFDDDSNPDTESDTDSDHNNNEDMDQMAALLVKSFKKMVYRNFKKGEDFPEKGARSGKPKKSKERCYNCDGLGHFVTDYRKPIAEKKQALISKKRNWDDSSDSDDAINYALMAIVNAETNNAELKKQLKQKLKDLYMKDKREKSRKNRNGKEECSSLGQWMLRRMTSYKSKLSEFEEKVGPRFSYGDGNLGKILGYGKIKVGNVIIENVALVTGLKHNLISVSQICDRDRLQAPACWRRRPPGVPRGRFVDFAEKTFFEWNLTILRVQVLSTMGDPAARMRALMEFSQPKINDIQTSIVRPAITANTFEIKPGIIQWVQNSIQFGGSPTEDPNMHIRDFIEIYDTFKFNGVFEDTVKLRLFPFSLRDKAKSWLHSLPNGLITTWEDLAQKFLTKFFPMAKTAAIRNAITQFAQQSGESLYEAWEHYKEMLRKCPHHGMPDWMIITYFYNGLGAQSKSMLDAAAGGALWAKSY
ncbi:hypothetical protein AgCh_026159 [Apium graveolens]